MKLYAKFVILVTCALTSSHVFSLTRIQSAQHLCQALQENPLDELISSKKFSASKDVQDRLSKVNFEDECSKLDKLIDVGHYQLFQHQDSAELYEFYIDKEKQFRFNHLKYWETKLHVRQLMPKNGEAYLPTYVLRPKSIPFSVKRDGILTQSPYFGTGKGSLSGKLYSSFLEIEHFDIILSGTRGSLFGKSNFSWLDWKQARDDSRAIIDEIVNQSWNTKSLMVAGVSYNGFMALAAATTYHPAIKMVHAGSAPFNPYRHSLSNGGNYNEQLVYELKNTSKLIREYNYYDTLRNYYNSNIISNEDTLKMIYKGAVPRLTEDQMTEYNVNFNEYRNDSIIKTQNHDFVRALQKVTIPIILEFGTNNDQDSLDTMDLYKELKGSKNIKLVTHDYGHTSWFSPAYSLIDKQNQRETSSNSILSVADDLKEYTYLKYRNDKWHLESYNSYDEYLKEQYPNKLTMTDVDVSSHEDKLSIFGVLKVRFKVSGVKKTVRVEICPLINGECLNGGFSNIRVDKDGKYEATSQHVNVESLKSIGVYKRVLEISSKNSGNTDIKIDDIEFIFNAK